MAECESLNAKVVDQKNPPVLQGKLWKRGPMIGYGWKDYWFTLRRGRLEYHADGRRQEKKGHMDFQPDSRVVPFQDPLAPGDAAKHVAERPFGFVVDTDPKAGKDRKLAYIDPGDGEAQTQWIAAITAVGEASLPPQLHKLPRAGLNRVQIALAVLEQAGFKNVADLGGLSGSLRGALEAGLDGCPTTYSEMCFWAASRSTWLAALEGSKQPACSLEEATAEGSTRLLDQLAEENREATAKCEASLGNGIEAYEELRRALETAKFPEMWKKRRFPVREARRQRCGMRECEAPPQLGVGSSPEREQFAKFAEAMLAASKEIIMMGVEGWKPRSFGAGRGVLFSTVWVPAGATAPRPKPQRKVAEPSVSLPSVKPQTAQAVITLHVGGAGCGMGVALWESLFKEHNIDTSDENYNGMATGTHFVKTQHGRHVPRAVFVDFDSAGVADASGMGKIAPADIIAGFASNGGTTWAELKYKRMDLVDLVEDQVRLQMEKADCPAAILSTHSCFGHAGGLMDPILDRLCDSYRKVMKWSVALAPHCESEGDLGTAIAYNPVLAMRSMLERNDLTTFVDNAALHKLATTKRGGLGLEDPTVKDYNGIVARVVSAFTSPLRTGVMVSASDGMQRLTPKDALTNLVPYPRIHFTVPSLAPLYSEAVAGFFTDDPYTIIQQALFSGRLTLYDASGSQSLATALYCRGGVGKSYIPFRGFPCEDNWAYPRPRGELCESKLRGMFVKYSRGLLVGSHLDVSIPGTIGLGQNNFETVALHNTSGILSVFKKWGEQFDEAYSSRKDVDTYAGFGVEEGEFNAAREALTELCAEYIGVFTELPDEEEEESGYGSDF